jgi:hypothetical protein
MQTIKKAFVFIKTTMWTVVLPGKVKNMNKKQKKNSATTFALVNVVIVILSTLTRNIKKKLQYFSKR